MKKTRLFSTAILAALFAGIFGSPLLGQTITLSSLAPNQVHVFETTGEFRTTVDLINNEITLEDLNFSRASGFGTLGSGSGPVINYNGFMITSLELVLAVPLSGSSTFFVNFASDADTPVTPITLVGGTTADISFVGSSIAASSSTWAGSVGNSLFAGPPSSTLASVTQYDGSFIRAEISAIPEPSTYAALLGGLAFGVAANRRRRS